MKKIKDTKKFGGIVAVVAVAAIVIAISANAVDERTDGRQDLAATAQTEAAASGTVQTGTSQARDVTEESARQTALDHAGITASDITTSSVRTDIDDGRSVYDVEFLTASDKYDYEIDAVTGEIIKHEKEALQNNRTDSSTGNTTSGSTSAGNTTSGSDIGKDKAQSIALDHAGVKASQATIRKVTRDYEDGVPVYDVEFITSEWEYSYEIQASDGTVRQADREKLEVSSGNSGQNTSDSSGSGNGNISVDKAKEIALDHSGVSGKVNYTKAKMERDDGVNVYEIEFFQNGMEYEYEILASDGTILDWSADKDD